MEEFFEKGTLPEDDLRKGLRGAMQAHEESLYDLTGDQLDPTELGQRGGVEQVGPVGPRVPRPILVHGDPGKLPEPRPVLNGAACPE